ncbi:uncharacterized protein LOC128235198 [Mya arenaria]|uniref:uncharacterized protein LOC128235198 n=1 Tax=Mya arenaria TaxID=6604 RepID=UPI0022E79345|nr:uncharacterized protein LOC128235198 [Mya arenaria]
MTDNEKNPLPEYERNDTSDVETFASRELKDVKSLNFWRAFFAEYVGTFLLCFYTILYGLYNPDTHDPTTLLAGAIGTAFIVGCLINSLVNVSGGHINPVLSIGFLAAGQLTLIRFLCYVVSQCCASITAVLVIRELVPAEMHGNLGLILPGEGITSGQALVMEFFISFMLLFGTFAFIDEERTDNTTPVPIYVGMIVASNILCGARISGACMNPARNFGPAIVNADFHLQWLYWVGPLLGGAAGSLTYTQLFSARAMNGCSFSLCRKRRRRAPRKQDRKDQEAEHML